MKTNSVVIAGYYGFENAGDELILSALIHKVRAEQPGAEITVLTFRLHETAERHAVQTVNRWHPWAWVGPLSRARRFILGGGGLLQETTGIWNHVYYLGLLWVAKFFGCRNEITAIGVDPIANGFNRWITRLTFGMVVDSASVRDTDSRKALEAAGVFFPVKEVRDLVFGLPVAHTQKDRAKESRIAIAVAPWSRRTGWEHDLAYLADRIAGQWNIGVDFLVFFPEQDAPIAHKAAGLAHTPVHVRLWHHPGEVLTWMADYDLVISMRYHALVLAALSEKAFIGWGYERKVRTLCRDFGQPMWTFERGWDAEAVFRQISEAWRNREIMPDRYRPRASHTSVQAARPVYQRPATRF